MKAQIHTQSQTKAQKMPSKKGAQSHPCKLGDMQRRVLTLYGKKRKQIVCLPRGKRIRKQVWRKHDGYKPKQQRKPIYAIQNPRERRVHAL